MAQVSLTLAIVIAAALALVAVALNQLIELTAPAMFVLNLAVGLAFMVLWDRLIMKGVDIRREIVEDQNTALAILYLVPALILMAAAAAV